MPFKRCLCIGVGRQDVVRRALEVRGTFVGHPSYDDVDDDEDDDDDDDDDDGWGVKTSSDVRWKSEERSLDICLTFVGRPKDIHRTSAAVATRTRFIFIRNQVFELVLSQGANARPNNLQRL